MPAANRRLVPEALLLDVPEIDAAHEAILDLLASMKASSLAGQALTPKMAEQMMAGLSKHFSTEERFAKEAGIDFSEHAKKHEELLFTVSNLMAATLRGSNDVFSTLRYIEYWFERHIADEDRRLTAGRMPCRPQGPHRLSACRENESGG